MPPSRPSETTAGACTDADVDRLRLLHRALAHGHSIGRLAPLTNEELHHLASEPAARRRRRRTRLGGRQSMRPRSPPRSRATTRQPSIGDGSTCCGPAPARAAPRRTDAHAGAVGDDWHRQRAGIAQEHLMSSTMRNILGSSCGCTRAQRRAVALRDPAGERHESARLAPRCWRPAAAWASPISRSSRCTTLSRV